MAAAGAGGWGAAAARETDAEDIRDALPQRTRNNPRLVPPGLQATPGADRRRCRAALA